MVCIGVSMPCVRRFTFGGEAETDYGRSRRKRFNAVRPAFHIRRNRGSIVIAHGQSFQCRASGVSHSEGEKGDVIATWGSMFQCRASGVSHSEGVADQVCEMLSVDNVSMPCVRRFTFGVCFKNLSLVRHRRFNAVRPAFHIRRLEALTALGIEDFGFQCRASGVSHSENEEIRKMGVFTPYVSMPCVRRFTFGAGFVS